MIRLRFSMDKSMKKTGQTEIKDGGDRTEMLF